jgi:hypothetical protein
MRYRNLESASGIFDEAKINDVLHSTIPPIVYAVQTSGGPIDQRRWSGNITPDGNKLYNIGTPGFNIGTVHTYSGVFNNIQPSQDSADESIGLEAFPWPFVYATSGVFNTNITVGGTSMLDTFNALYTIQTSGGPVDARQVTSHIIPDTSGAYDLGTLELPFRDVHATSGKLHTLDVIDFIDLEEKDVDIASPSVNKIRLYAKEDDEFTVIETITDLGVVNRVNQDTFRVARNTSGGALAKGTVVYLSGSTGNKPNFAAAQSNAIGTMPAVGVLATATNNNAYGEVMIIGKITGLKTNYTYDGHPTYAPVEDWAEGNVLYVNAAVAGALQNSKPNHPNFSQWIATIEVVHEDEGVLLVKTQAMLGLEDGTNNNVYTIGDTDAGVKSLKFDGANDSTLQWDSDNSKWFFSSGNVGIGTSGSLNKLDVAGASVIGSAYAGVKTAPTDGLLVEGELHVDTINEDTAAAGVTIDGVKLKDSEPYCDVINEKTGAAGVTIDGVKLKDSQPYCDVINEKTGAAGVTIDGVKLKDSEVTTDVINEKTGAAGVTIDGTLIKDNGLSATGTVSVSGILKFRAVSNPTMDENEIAADTQYVAAFSILRLYYKYAGYVYIFESDGRFGPV